VAAHRRRSTFVVIAQDHVSAGIEKQGIQGAQNQSLATSVEEGCLGSLCPECVYATLAQPLPTGIVSEYCGTIANANSRQSALALSLWVCVIMKTTLAVAGT
jgi:hypothetical protein